MNRDNVKRARKATIESRSYAERSTALVRAAGDLRRNVAGQEDEKRWATKGLDKCSVLL